ncbi:MAG: hypothetical protein COA57_13180 [Flavobacteriales bacterium]|nr:MAG: hypothetical protein COA57_13180 [Flavobacteriales bacterium]
MTNTGNNFDGNVTIQNAGGISVNDNATFIRNGGANTFKLLIQGIGSSMNVNLDMIWDINSGTEANNELTINDNGTLTVQEDLKLDYSGGMKIMAQLNNTATLNVLKDILFIATADNLVELKLNNSAVLNIGRFFVRGTPKYGLLNCNAASKVVYNGNKYIQVFADTAGSGTGDVFSYMNVQLNNSRPTIPQVTMAGSARIHGILTLTDGVLQTTNSNKIYMRPASSMTAGSNASFIQGPATYSVNTVSSITNVYQVGQNNQLHQVDLTIDQTTNTETEYTVEAIESPAEDFGYSLPGTIDLVSKVRHYSITQSLGTALDDAKIKIYYVPDDGVSDVPNLAVVKDDGASNWIDLSGTGSGSPSGSIISGSFTSFSKFALGNKSGGGNPLPICLLHFSANENNSQVDLSWSTASEINNNYFTVEKSRDAVDFEFVIDVPGAGTSNQTLYYSDIDLGPYRGLSYYRLKQTDYDGSFRYSDLVIVKIKEGGNDEVYFSVQPNPATDVMEVIFGGEIRGKNAPLISEYSGKIFIFDAQAKLIYEKELGSSFTKLGVNLTYFNQGIYFVTLISNDKLYKAKFVKE